MKKFSRLTAFVVGVAALAMVAAVSASAAGNPHATYTCVKIKQNGDSDVRVDVPEPSVAGHENAGFTCVLNESDEGDDLGNDDEGPAGDDGPAGDQGTVDDEGSDNEGAGSTASGVIVDVPQEPRSLYCSTSPLQRANGDGVGVALNLTDSQGELMVELGLVHHAMFYEGLGASCDVLPGFTYAGIWVDHVGALVPGVAVYPLFVSA